MNYLMIAVGVVVTCICMYYYWVGKNELADEKDTNLRLGSENAILTENANIAVEQMANMEQEIIRLRNQNGKTHAKMLQCQQDTVKSKEIAEKRGRVLDQSVREITNLKRKVKHNAVKLAESHASHQNLKIEFTNLMAAHKSLKESNQLILRPKTEWDDIVQLNNDEGAKKKRFIVTGTVVLTQNEINLIKKRNLAHIATKEI